MKNVRVIPVTCIPRNAIAISAGIVWSIALVFPAFPLLAQQTAPPPATKDEKAVQMDKFIVEGALLGKARAQDIQKQATNVVNVISSDSMGTFPDMNAAEALARLPGMDFVRSMANRFVTIRGAPDGVQWRPDEERLHSTLRGSVGTTR